jgi:hypothetical protein
MPTGGNEEEAIVSNGIGTDTVDAILAAYPEVREHPGLVRKVVEYREIAEIALADDVREYLPHLGDILEYANTWGYFMVPPFESPWDAAVAEVEILWPGCRDGGKVRATVHFSEDETFIRPGGERNWVARPGWVIGAPATHVGLVGIPDDQEGHIPEEYALYEHLKATDPARLKLPGSH